MEDDQNKEEEKKEWKTNQSTKINLIGCDTIVKSPSSLTGGRNFEILLYI